MVLTHCLFLDYKCQYYGIQSFIFNKILVMKLKPKFIDYYPLRFVFLDENEYEYIAKGFKYDNFEFEIDSIISYGYVTDSFLVVNCLDANDSLHTLVFSNDMGEIAIEDNSFFEDYGSKFNVSINNIIRIRSKKNIAIIVFLVSLVVFFNQLRRYRSFRT